MSGRNPDTSEADITTKLTWVRISHDKGRDVIVIPASTVMREGPWHVRLKKGEGGLTAPSVLLCEQITTVPKDCLDPTPLGGPLSAARIGEVERAVLRAIGVP